MRSGPTGPGPGQLPGLDIRSGHSVQTLVLKDMHRRYLDTGIGPGQPAHTLVLKDI